MNNPQNARRPRARNNKRSKRPANGSRIDQKVRGNPKQLLEKYKNLARDALQAGERIDAENYLQHADHYQRVLNERNGLSSGLYDEDEDELEVEDAPRPSRRHRREAHEAAEADRQNDAAPKREDQQPAAQSEDAAPPTAVEPEAEPAATTETQERPKRRTRRVGRPRKTETTAETEEQPALDLSKEEAAA